MTTAEKLQVTRAASNLIEKNGWARDSYARTERGLPSLIGSEDACQFCLMGGLVRSAMNLGIQRRSDETLVVISPILDDLKKLIGGEVRLGDWNDRQDNVDDVLVLLEKYIEDLEKEAA